MKPLFRKILDASGYSFSFAEESPPLFETPWHFHPEFELIHISGANGKRFMGDHIADFDAEELVLIGPNIPHFWQVDTEADWGKAKAYVMHFRECFLGEDFYKLPELHNINNLLVKAKRSIRITGTTNTKVCALMRKISSYRGFQRLLVLQEILFVVSESTSLEVLASQGFVDSFRADREDRINKVFEYIMYHFRQKITLRDVSSIAYMSEIAFCRYFKSRTGKSFFAYLNDIKIGYACRLLQETDRSIMDISYESGFNNLSHFNRKFKENIKETPRQYRDRFKK